VQRFSSVLQSFVHFHVVVPDGVFTRAAPDGAVTFHEGCPPSCDDVAAIAVRVAKRMSRWLRRKKLIDERAAEDRSNELPEMSPLEACIQASLFAGELVAVREEQPPPGEDDGDDARFHPKKKSPWSAEVQGFNIHAGVSIRAGDREGLERLCRYASRAPLSLERLSLLEDGRVAYRLRKARKNGATYLVMTPIELLAKLAALVPPPRFPLIRFAGVLAPGSSWRASVVPAQKRAASVHACGTATKAAADKTKPRASGSAAAGDTPAHACGPAAEAKAAEDETEPRDGTSGSAEQDDVCARGRHGSQRTGAGREGWA
jgi:hypothetical protein